MARKNAATVVPTVEQFTSDCVRFHANNNSATLYTSVLLDTCHYHTIFYVNGTRTHDLDSLDISYTMARIMGHFLPLD